MIFRFSKQQLPIILFEDLPKTVKVQDVYNKEMFIEYLTKKANSKVNKYCELKYYQQNKESSKLDDYFFKGNIEWAILHAITIESGRWSTLIEIEDQVLWEIDDFFLQKNKIHTLEYKTGRHSVD